MGRSVVHSPKFKMQLDFSARTKISKCNKIGEDNKIATLPSMLVPSTLERQKKSTLENIGFTLQTCIFAQ